MEEVSTHRQRMSFQGDSIFWVEVEKVVPNPFQPRREFDEEKLRELAESIQMYGVLQPLTVTRKEVHSDDGAFRSEYELIAGERRLRASRLAGVAQVPVIIRSGEQTEQEKLELAIIENLQREDLNAVDRALAFKQLADAFNLSHSQVAKKVGRSREYVSNSIRLLGLPDLMLEGLKRGEISEGHARTLLMLKERPQEQEVLYREILLKKLSVREVERISRKIATDKVRKKEYKDTDAHLIEIEREFTDTLGTRVQILKTDFGGKLTIDYFSENDLATLLTAMKRQDMKIVAGEMTPVSKEDDAVSTTVIQEMDTSDGGLGDLSASTPLEVVGDKVEDRNDEAEKVVPESPSTTPDVSSEHSAPAEPEKTEQPPTVTSPEEMKEEAVSAHTSPVDAPPEETSPTEVPAQTPAIGELPSFDEVPKEQAEEMVAQRDEKPVQPEVPEEAEPAKAAEAPTSELRAKLEAELARLDALEQEKPTPAAETASPAAEQSSDKQGSDDDDLYAIKNFNL